MLRILSLDPSGTGTTGICLIEGQKISFQEIKSKDWVKHREHIYDLLRDFQPNLVLYENTNYINSRGSDMTSLLKLIGAIESLPVQPINSVPVNQVKDLKSKLLKGTKPIPALTYSQGRGKGWFFNHQKISNHELDAYLVYWLWKEREGKHA